MPLQMTETGSLAQKNENTTMMFIFIFSTALPSKYNFLNCEESNINKYKHW